MSASNVQRLLVIFPAGLILLGVASFLFYFMSKKAVAPEDESKLSRSSTEITEAELRGFVETLAIKIGPRSVDEYEKLKAAETWLRSMLGESNFGYKVERQTYEVRGKEVSNLIVEIPGGSRGDEIVVVGAHYDSISGCPAANDNASGVAALLALARIFFETENERTLRFVAFVNEEPPFFQTENMGSLVYARSCRKRGDNIVAMLTPETLGYYTNDENSQQVPPGFRREDYPTKGNFIAFVTRPEDEQLVKQFEADFRGAVEFPTVAAALPESVPGVSFSDHWSFWQAGYPGFMATDTAMLRYPHYHLASDTPDKINFPAFTQVVRGLQGAVDALVNPGR